MGTLTIFLEGKLKLKVNAAKSACARPWERKFLGYSLTAHREPRLKIAKGSLKRLANRVREIVRGNATRSLQFTIERLNPLLRGWMAYFRLTEVTKACCRSWTGGSGASCGCCCGVSGSACTLG